MSTTRKRLRSQSPSQDNPISEPEQIHLEEPPTKRLKRTAAPTSFVDLTHSDGEEPGADETNKRGLNLSTSSKNSNGTTKRTSRVKTKPKTVSAKVTALGGGASSDIQPSRTYIPPPSWLTEAPTTSIHGLGDALGENSKAGGTDDNPEANLSTSGGGSGEPQVSGSLKGTSNAITAVDRRTEGNGNESSNQSQPPNTASIDSRPSFNPNAPALSQPTLLSAHPIAHAALIDSNNNHNTNIPPVVQPPPLQQPPQHPPPAVILPPNSQVPLLVAGPGSVGTSTGGSRGVNGGEDGRSGQSQIIWLELPAKAPWQCPYAMCDREGKPFTQKSALERHVKSQHLGIRDHICHLCGTAFSRADVLKSKHLPVCQGIPLLFGHNDQGSRSSARPNNNKQ